VSFRRQRHRRGRTVAIAGAATAAAAITAGLVAARRRRALGSHDPRTEWACSCGQRYLVQGTDRHRVYWLSDTDLSDPLLGRECVNCGAPLPAGRESTVRA
jgi:hypothetical protein